MYHSSRKSSRDERRVGRLDAAAILVVLLAFAALGAWMVLQGGGPLGPVPW